MAFEELSFGKAFTQFLCFIAASQNALVPAAPSDYKIIVPFNNAVQYV
jgi:hypothetical protein